jgi:hypothetical protein
MFELTINEQVYQFRFGIGFFKEINKTAVRKSDGMTMEQGFQLAVAKMLDGDLTGLVDILDYGNKNQNPRLTRKAIEDYLDECEDVEELVNQVLDFLEKSNSTKRITKDLREMDERQKRKREED